jgi:acetyl esterase/lipase
LSGLPPIQVSVGTLDLLLDDALFLYTRLLAARVRSELVLLPGGTHGFDLAPEPLPITEQLRERQAAFLAALL